MRKIIIEIIINPDLDERKLNRYYFAKMYCENCNDPAGLGFTSEIDIMVRNEKKKLNEVFICPNCGCNTLKIQYKKAR